MTDTQDRVVEVALELDRAVLERDELEAGTEGWFLANERVRVLGEELEGLVVS